MLRTKRKIRFWFRTAVFVSSSSFLGLICLAILFYSIFLMRKEPVISPLAVLKKLDAPNMKKLLTNANISYSFIDMASDYYDITLKDGGKIYISSKKNIEAQISSLQAMLKQLTIDGKGFKLIDFRFDKPVIKLL